MATANSRRNEDAREDDLYTTPPWATRALLKRETFVGGICDAGCGLNHITDVLVDAGYDVKGVDLYDRGCGESGIDFTKYTEQHDNVISNPPFTLLTEFILNAVKLSRNKTAIFARINVFETMGRFNEIYSVNPPHRVYLFSNRVNCPKGGEGDEGDEGGSAVLYCWLVWDHSLPIQDHSKLYWLEDKAPKKPKKPRKKRVKKVVELAPVPFEIDIEVD